MLVLCETLLLRCRQQSRRRAPGLRRYHAKFRTPKRQGRQSL